MSQFQESYGGEGGFTEPARTSGLAIGSLVCSLIFFCPITTIIGPILGVIALATMGGDPPRKGKGLAAIGIILGVVFTAGQFYFGSKAYQFMAGYISFVMEGPDEALSAGMDGDIVAFKASFHGPGATASDEEARAFMDALRERYGDFGSAAFDQQSGQPPMGQPGQAAMPFPYIIEFSSGRVDAEVELVFADESTGEVFKKLGYITVFDEELGDLTYPSSRKPTGADAPSGDEAASEAGAEAEGDGS